MVEVRPSSPPDSPVQEAEAVLGVLKGTGSDARYRLAMVPNDSPVSVGDSVLTTGFDAKFPRGLFVGKVESVEKGDLFQRIEVAIPVRLSALDGVQVRSGK